MFSNFIKKIASKDYLLFAQCFFDFTSGGEQDCKVRIVNYDFGGNIIRELNFDEIVNDFLFDIYGNYMVVWFAQMIDNAIRSRDIIALNKLFFGEKETLSDILFNSNTKYNLSDALSLFSPETKATVITRHVAVQFKIHKISRCPVVLTVNNPISQEVECQMYLFVLLFDFFCKRYGNAHKLLCDGCKMLITRENEFSDSKSFQAIAYEITTATGNDHFRRLLGMDNDAFKKLIG